MTLQTNLLKGERIYLGALTKDHQPQLMEWENDIDYRRLLTPMPFRPHTIEGQNEWYDGLRKNDSKIVFAVLTIEDDKFIGTVEAMSINWQARNCWLGIGIGDKGYQGKGYGQDIIKVFLRYVFMEMNLHRVMLGVFGYNEHAIKAYEKAGFTRECHLRDATWKDGQFYDEHHMSILRPEWEAQQG